MTTIAYDGKTLAVDSRGTSSGMLYEIQKIWRLADGRLFGGAGESGIVLEVKDWLDGSAGKPTLKNEDQFNGLLIGLQGEIWRLDPPRLALERVIGTFHAMGSGRDYAMAAMHLGKPAAEAVELAKLFDVYTGGPVLTLELTS